MAITMKADPYTIVVIPNVRGPVAYALGGFNVSVPQLSVVDYAEAMRGRLSYEFTMSNVAHYYVTSGSGNIVTVMAFTASHVEVAAGSGLSHETFGLRAYGH